MGQPDSSATIDLAGDAARQCLARLDGAPVNGVDMPDGALSEDLVLGEGDELAQDSRRELGGEDGIGGTIAGEGPEWRLTNGDPFESGRAVDAPALDWPGFWAFGRRRPRRPNGYVVVASCTTAGQTVYAPRLVKTAACPTRAALSGTIGGCNSVYRQEDSTGPVKRHSLAATATAGLSQLLRLPNDEEAFTHVA